MKLFLKKFFRYPIEFLIFIISISIFKIIPIKYARSFGILVAKTVGPNTSIHKLLLNNLRIAFPKKDKLWIEDTAFKSWINIGCTIAEYSHLKKVSENIDLVENNYLEEIKSQKKNCIIVSAHSANWEVPGMSVKKLPIDISAIVREPNNQFVNSYIRILRSKYSVKCYSKNKAGTKKLLSNFRNGDSLALLADQQLSSGIEMSFFKKKMKFSSLPAQLGLKYHCDIYLGWPIRKEDYSLSFEIIDCIKTQGLSQTDEEIQNITKKIIEFYELMIEKYPHQYFWLHDRWKIKLIN